MLLIESRFPSFTALNASANDTTPLLSPFLHSVYHGSFNQAGSYRQSFYSPVNSVLNSDDDEVSFDISSSHVAWHLPYQPWFISGFLLPLQLIR
jgi:hypothetical protein